MIRKSLHTTEIIISAENSKQNLVLSDDGNIPVLRTSLNCMYIAESPKNDDIASNNRVDLKSLKEKLYGKNKSEEI